MTIFDRYLENKRIKRKLSYKIYSNADSKNSTLYTHIYIYIYVIIRYIYSLTRTKLPNDWNKKHKLFSFFFLSLLLFRRSYSVSIWRRAKKKNNSSNRIRNHQLFSIEMESYILLLNNVKCLQNTTKERKKKQKQKNRSQHTLRNSKQCKMVHCSRLYSLVESLSTSLSIPFVIAYEVFPYILFLSSVVFVFFFIIANWKNSVSS